MLPIGSTGGPVRQHRIYPRSCALFKCVIDVELGLSYDLSPETALNWLEERRSGGWRDGRCTSDCLRACFDFCLKACELGLKVRHSRERTPDRLA